MQIVCTTYSSTEHRFKCTAHSTEVSRLAACASPQGNEVFVQQTEKYICSRSAHPRLVRTTTHGSLLVHVTLLGTAESLPIIHPRKPYQIESVVASHSSSLEAGAVAALDDLLAHRLGALHVSLSSHLARLVVVLGGLDGQHDVLSLAVHAHSALLADSHALRTTRENGRKGAYEYTLVTFILSVEKVVILQPCFCFLRKEELFLTMFQTSSEDIYATMRTHARSLVGWVGNTKGRQTYSNKPITNESMLFCGVGVE